MRRIVLGLSLAAFSLVGWLPSPASAQDNKTARGTVTAMAGDVVTVKAGERELRFTVTDDTVLTASGAGTASRQAASASKPGPKLSDFVKVGDPVEVTYRETGTTMVASRIRRVPSAGPGGGSTSDDKAETANGRVESVSAGSLTISGAASGGAKFSQTFTIDSDTVVIAHGASTASAAAAAKGEKMGITSFVATGDRVSVLYHKRGTSLHAAEVRVREKAQ